MSINKFKNAWISTDTTNNGYSLVNEGKTRFNDDISANKIDATEYYKNGVPLVDDQVTYINNTSLTFNDFGTILLEYNKSYQISLPTFTETNSAYVGKKYTILRNPSQLAPPVALYLDVFGGGSNFIIDGISQNYVQFRDNYTMLTIICINTVPYDSINNITTDNWLIIPTTSSLSSLPNYLPYNEINTTQQLYSQWGLIIINNNSVNQITLPQIQRTRKFANYYKPFRFIFNIQDIITITINSPSATSRTDQASILYKNQIVTSINITNKRGNEFIELYPIIESQSIDENEDTVYITKWIVTDSNTDNLLDTNNQWMGTNEFNNIKSNQIPILDNDLVNKKYVNDEIANINIPIQPPTTDNIYYYGETTQLTTDNFGLWLIPSSSLNAGIQNIQIITGLNNVIGKKYIFKPYIEDTVHHVLPGFNIFFFFPPENKAVYRGQLLNYDGDTQYFQMMSNPMANNQNDGATYELLCINNVVNEVCWVFTKYTDDYKNTYITANDAFNTFQQKSDMTNYLLTADAQTTYQLQSDMTNYLLTADAQTNYQSISSMSNYLTTANAQTTYQLKADMSNYLTTANAQTQYQSISNMTNYLTTANAQTQYQLISNMTNYLTTANAQTQYQSISNMTNYLTTADAQTQYQLISNMANYLLTSDAQTQYQLISNMTNYLTTADAQTQYQLISNMVNYLLTSDAQTQFQLISNMSNYSLKTDVSTLLSQSIGTNYLLNNGTNVDNIFIGNNAGNALNNNNGLLRSVFIGANTNALNLANISIGNSVCIGYNATTVEALEFVIGGSVSSTNQSYPKLTLPNKHRIDCNYYIGALNSYNIPLRQNQNICVNSNNTTQLYLPTPYSIGSSSHGAHYRIIKCFTGTSIIYIYPPSGQYILYNGTAIDYYTMDNQEFETEFICTANNGNSWTVVSKNRDESINYNLLLDPINQQITNLNGDITTINTNLTDINFQIYGDNNNGIISNFDQINTDYFILNEKFDILTLKLTNLSYNPDLDQTTLSFFQTEYINSLYDATTTNILNISNQNATVKFNTKNIILSNNSITLNSYTNLASNQTHILTLPLYSVYQINGQFNTTITLPVLKSDLVGVQITIIKDSVTNDITILPSATNLIRDKQATSAENNYHLIAENTMVTFVCTIDRWIVVNSLSSTNYNLISGSLISASVNSIYSTPATWNSKQTFNYAPELSIDLTNNINANYVAPASTLINKGYVDDKISLVSTNLASLVNVVMGTSADQNTIITDLQTSITSLQTKNDLQDALITTNYNNTQKITYDDVALATTIDKNVILGSTTGISKVTIQKNLVVNDQIINDASPANITTNSTISSTESYSIYGVRNTTAITITLPVPDSTQWGKTILFRRTHGANIAQVITFVSADGASVMYNNATVTPATSFTMPANNVRTSITCLLSSSIYGWYQTF